MEKLFFQMPCLSESREIHAKEIYECFFDKKVDQRNLESSIQRFSVINKEMLSFAGISLDIYGIANNLSIKFTTSGYIGAIPIKMPYDGIAHKDFQITPRFDSSNQVLSDLTQLLSKLEYSISPEYAYGNKLNFSQQLRPPVYYEAVKFIDLFIRAQKENWVKFEVVDGIHDFPKSNTNWSKYAVNSSDPVKALQYPSSDNVLSVNHKEWRNLKYVFELAKDIIMQTNVPNVIRYKYRDILQSLEKKTAAINPLATKEISIHAFDPQAIKDAKKQANTLLHGSSTSCVAWRIDMAKLFERYVQYVVNQSLRAIGGTVIPNTKIRGKGQIPHWGLKYLEPDIMIKYNSSIFMADAKYKANYYASSKQSDILKETHRADLHQLLAYCSFSPNNNKTGLLFYPANEPSYKKLSYVETLGGITNNVYLCGIPFGIKEIDTSVSEIKKIFQKME